MASVYCLQVLTTYINKAMQRASFEQMEDGRCFGSIEGFAGLWAEADSADQCRAELQSALEDWIMLGISLHHELPVVDGIRLVVRKTA